MPNYSSHYCAFKESTVGWEKFGISARYLEQDEKRFKRICLPTGQLLNSLKIFSFDEAENEDFRFASLSTYFTSQYKM